MTQGMVFDIQRFSIHDGPGIRTTVFLKGCPLHCLWCHNPEGQEAQPEILFAPEKCISCRYCEQVCQQASHRFLQELHVFERSECDRCGDCTLECYAKALELSGETMTVQDVLEEVLKDQAFYQASGGGMTLSGGEPMQQFEFVLALAQAARQAGLHTCLETSGCSTMERFQEIAPYIDLFYFDLKETNPHLHRQYTGVSNLGIVANLLALDQAGAAITLRCPIIPGLNDRIDHFQGIAEIASRLRGLDEVHILPYHPLGSSKSQRLGKAVPQVEAERPPAAQVQAWVDGLQNLTPAMVCRD